MGSSSVVSSSSNASAAPKEATRPSGRKGSRKVRTGCLTCKIRKVKCDETKPSCVRCTKTGRKCDGYAEPAPRAQSSRMPSLIPELLSSDDYHAFDYYRVRSAAVLGGIVREGGDDFWSGLVIRLAVSEPAVRHALLALSCLHENVLAIRDRSHVRIPNTAFAFGEYGKAMAAISKWTPPAASASEPATLPLLVCLLFICIEFLMDYEEAAQVHISQGRKILSQIDPAQAMGSTPSAVMLRNVLVPIYTRLSLASYLFGQRPASIPDFFLGDWATPFSFASVREARDALFGLMNSGLQLRQPALDAAYSPDVPREQYDAVAARQQALLARLAQWDAAFAVLEATQGGARSALLDLLRMYHHTAHIFAATVMVATELAYDAHTQRFAAILSHASAAVAGAGSSLRRDNAAFVFETELILPLYYVAIKCRHPQLRRAAVRMLSRREILGRRENFWRARDYVAVASKAIEMEEAHITSSMDTASPGEATAAAAEAGGYGDDSWTAEEVPVWQPPCLGPRPLPNMMNLSLYDDPASMGRTPSPDGPQSSASPADLSGLEDVEDMGSFGPARLTAPFQVPEEVRFRNILVMDKVDGGVRVIVFRDPGLGGTQWKVKKFFWEV